MTATIAPITTTRIAQPRSDTASILRPDRAGDAPSFAEVLAGQAETDSATQAEVSDENTEKKQQESSEPEADPGEGSESVQSESPQNGAVEPESTGLASVVVGSAREADAAVATIRGVERELTHAATVDLARLARDKLVAEPIQVPIKNPGKFPAGSGAPLTPPPTHPNLSPSSGGTMPPNPGVDPDPAGADAPRPDPRAGSANDRFRAAGPDAAVKGYVEPAKAEAARGQAIPRQETVANPVANGRAELLTRLTGSAEAARGAIAGVDRAGSQTIDRDARPGRANHSSQDLTPRATREQVLASVQRGLASVLTQGGGRMTVVLRPEQLGEVRVRMEAKDGVINARLSANTEAARQTLESGLESLRAALESRGMRVESLEIDAPDPKADGQARTDAEARGGWGGGRHHRESGSNQHAPAHARGEHPAPGAESPATRGIWTDIGIDAIA